MKKSLVTVVIPIHQEEPSALEKVSLQQTLRILHKHPITFMTKKGLNVSWYQDFCRDHSSIHFERFSWEGFNEFGELMTSAQFYKRFRRYEYILICHLDAFVFRDDLEKWCEYGFDYIGSLIYNTHWNGIRSRFHRLLGFTTPDYYANGGFALKRVEGFYNVTSKFRLYIGFYHWLRRVRSRLFLDDIFVVELFPNLYPKFKLPPKTLVQHFGAAYEKWEETQLPFSRENCGSFLFGCHGWIQYNPEFWKPSISGCGYDVAGEDLVKREVRDYADAR
jgi:hypothetical protein